jgi:molecular chaperone DnaK
VSDSNVNGSFAFIHDNQNNTSIPTCVAFSETGELHIGQSARDLSYTQPKRAICSLEDILRNKTDNTAGKAEEDVNDIVLPTVNFLSDGKMKTYTRAESVALFFRGIKDMAEDFTGQRVSNVVVSVSLTSIDLQKV